MTPDRLQQIEELYHSVREAAPRARAALLEQADPELRREVESLLGRQNDRVILDGSAQLPEDPTLTILGSGLTAGARLGPYQMESKLGEGGMGEVFRAVDTRLGRAVAIKTAHERFSDRFEREARAISSLNHPHICTLYDVGPNYLVMELVEGETIAARLKSEPLSLKTAVLYASQIASALAEAHGKGIIHRDLKPGNLMIAKSGVKVLDFGLAKSGGDDTITASRAVMGTPAYMAPEQREGKPADARSDIYSFGCVLYEMVTGARPGFGRRIPSRRLERIVTRCLEQKPERRWQSVTELEQALSALNRPAQPWKDVAAATLAVLVLVAAGYFYLHRAPKLTDKDTIVLADFENKTGDPVFDDTLRQGLSVELQQSPFLSLIGDQQVQKTLALIGQPKGARLTPETALQVCERTGSAAVLEGSIASFGSQYVLGLQAKTCSTGNMLDQEQAQAPRREDVLNTLSQIARKFRTRVGESLAMVEKHSTPLQEATTSSLEALKAYSTGMNLHNSGGNAVGIPFFRRAVEIDPNFAMAYANLGFSYGNEGESVLAAENTKRAWQLRNRASERERYFIDFLYDLQVTGNAERTYQTLETWYRMYPGDGDPPTPQGLLGGNALFTGRFERAIEVGKKELAVHPDVSFSYGNLALSYFFLDRFAEADALLQRAAERKMANPNQLLGRYEIAALKGDQGQMDQIAALAKGKQGAEYRVTHAEALSLARSGRLGAARVLSNRAADLAVQAGDHETAASYRAARGVWEAVYGNAAEARSSATAALKLSKGRDLEYAAGLGLAFSGDSSQAEALAGDLEKHFPEDTFVKFTYVPVLRAGAALGRGKAADIVQGLQVTIPYELAENGLNYGPHFYLGGLHSAYVRGEALLAEHRYAEAVAEFQKILDHRGIVGLDPIGALAQMQLGRVFASSGDKAKAKTAYESFFTLWKDADPDVPILKSAKAEYGRL